MFLCFTELEKMVRYCIDEKMLSLFAWEFSGFVAPILSLSDYVNQSLKLLDYSSRSQLFLDNWPVYTVTHNTPPALYGPNADVKNSFIANGCIIKGKVRNSIISRDVVIEEDTHIDNSIIFTKSVVGKGTKVNNVLADKYVRMFECHEVSGEPDCFLFIEQGAHLMKIVSEETSLQNWWSSRCHLFFIKRARCHGRRSIHHFALLSLH